MADNCLIGSIEDPQRRGQVDPWMFLPNMRFWNRSLIWSVKQDLFLHDLVLHRLKGFPFILTD